MSLSRDPALPVTTVKSNMTLSAQWRAFIIEQEKKEYFAQLLLAIRKERALGITIYPQDIDIFNAFRYTNIDNIKIIILGQDPYHGANQANGLAFSVHPQEKVPPSLKNIFKELDRSIPNFNIPLHGDLTHWAEQGVLLLNTVLTVQQGKAHSHAKLGWEQFTDQVITTISDVNPHCIFMLWGAHAQSKGVNIDRSKHLVLESVHPSPLSAYRGFLGCNHFLFANQWLKEHKMAEIEWCFKEDITLDLFDELF